MAVAQLGEVVARRATYDQVEQAMTDHTDKPTLGRADRICREAGIDPSNPVNLDDIRVLMLHVARKSGSWRQAGLDVLTQLDRLGDNNAEKYCALCFALGLISASEPRIGAGLRFAAPLVADDLLKAD